MLEVKFICFCAQQANLFKLAKAFAVAAQGTNKDNAIRSAVPNRVKLPSQWGVNTFSDLLARV